MDNEQYYFLSTTPVDMIGNSAPNQTQWKSTMDNEEEKKFF